MVKIDCVRCLTKLTRYPNTFVIKCDLCGMTHFLSSGNGAQYRLRIDNNNILFWDPHHKTCKFGTIGQFHYARHTLTDVGWQPFDIPIDTAKIWITFS